MGGLKADEVNSERGGQGWGVGRGRWVNWGTRFFSFCCSCFTFVFVVCARTQEASEGVSPGPRSRQQKQTSPRNDSKKLNGPPQRQQKKSAPETTAKSITRLGDDSKKQRAPGTTAKNTHPRRQQKSVPRKTTATNRNTPPQRQHRKREK